MTNLAPPTASTSATPRAASAALQPLFVDLAIVDDKSPSSIGQILAAGYPWAGIVLQCSQGLSMAGTWFDQCWIAARTLAQARYGVDWFRMPYHYLLLGERAIDQADLALRAVENAGGWGDGDLWMAVDIERGRQPANATAQQVIDHVTTFADRTLALTGKRPVLYAGSYTRDLGISSRMGCSMLWYPQWSSTLNWTTVARMGFDMNTTLLWQVTGDGVATVPGYPSVTPIGPEDYSILVRANLPADQALAWLRTHTGANPA